MKKTTLATALLLTTTMTAQADAIGAKVGYDFWKTANHGDAHSAYVQIEHPIPLVPNIGMKASKIDDDKKLKLNSYDLFGYYELMDNDNLSFDLGLGFRRMDSGKLYNQSFSDTLPMVTADVELFPESQFSFYGKLDAGKSSDTSFFDANAGVRLNLFAGINLQAGYREYRLDLDGTKNVHNKETIRGPHLGLHIDI